MKILVIRFSSIGDIVLTTPVLRCLKEQIPNVEVHYLTKKSYSSVISNNPNIDKLHVLTDVNDTIKTLREERFDIILDLHNNLRTHIFKFKLGVKSYTFKKLNIKKWILVNLKLNRLPKVHIVDRYIDSAKPLGISNDDKGLDFFIENADEFDINTLPESHKLGYIAFSIGGTHKTKCLSDSKLHSLCKAIEKPIILLGGKDSFEIANALELENSSKVINYCGKLTLGQSASLLKQAKLVISHDTGLMHIASAFHKIIISIWGNTVPEFGMFPYLPNEPEKNIIIENKGLKCRPCSKIGYKTCPKGHFKCMNEIDEYLVIEKVNQLFN